MFQHSRVRQQIAYVVEIAIGILVVGTKSFGGDDLPQLSDIDCNHVRKCRSGLASAD